MAVVLSNLLGRPRPIPLYKGMFPEERLDDFDFTLAYSDRAGNHALHA